MITREVNVTCSNGGTDRLILRKIRCAGAGPAGRYRAPPDPVGQGRRPGVAAGTIRRGPGRPPPASRCQAWSCQASPAPPVRPPPRPGERQGAELPRFLLSLPAGEPGCGPGEGFSGSPTLLLGFGRSGLHLRLPWVKRALASSSQKSTAALREEVDFKVVRWKRKLVRSFSSVFLRSGRLRTCGLMVAFLTLRGHPVAACSSEDIRPAQRDSDSAPKRLTLVGIASSSCGALSLCCSKFVLQGPQGFQLSFQFRRELSIFSATETAQLYIFTFVFSKEKATNRLHKG
ncbi:uncharacterized protein LOC126050445 [Accipiter gentilis]|uniref:uncharacterized protein LOC126050445 n=1 Tax=Astur gentilis TaxID=8957 RepID=UPI00210F3C6E|nr:uncharacterized protein LOC126050445 [Accipiter gentilis]